MAHALAEPAAAGLAPALLWVEAGNARARRFYALAGFRLDGAVHDFEVGGVKLPEVRYRRDG